MSLSLRRKLLLFSALIAVLPLLFRRAVAHPDRPR